jgi:hypothetical protein
MFVRNFVAKTCRDIIDDVEKLDAIQDGFIHYQLLRFCQDTHLQYINSHIMLNNRCVLQQQHVDCKIADALLKKDTKQHADGWDASSKDWAHMVLHLPHTEGGCGVTFNCVTKDAAFYTTTSRFVAWIGTFSQERQKLWLPKDDLRDSSAWSSPPLVLLRDIHSKLIVQYDWKEVCAPSQSQSNLGASARLSSQDGISQQQEAAPPLSRNSIASLRLPLRGMRDLPPTLVLLSFLHSLWSPSRSCFIGSPSGTLSLSALCHVVLNSQACAHNSA